ncbi:MAG: glycosyltransferase, partial [Actinobacteria bacterium]|nr:glycosyltransferase [Actinomycetota bacterium]
LGRPIVASRTTGISALIEDGKSGILAIPGSSESFAAGIEAIFRDGALADRLSRGARDRAAQFDASYVSKQLRRRLEAWI